MFTFDVVGTCLLFSVFFIEFILIMLHRPDKKLVNDIMANFLIGLFIVLAGLIEKGLAFSIFYVVYRYAIFTPGLSWWLWIAGFLCCDFIHYFYHWLGHRTRIFWAAHVTHHSSIHFNISTALRTNFIHVFYRFLFWSPLCFFGFPPEMILLIESITASQNFLVHTEKIGKLGILDWLFNTPSNHRVHHGCNPEYIDKNLGGILMIYDHLFGTYAKETIPPVYGITHNINTSNPFKILLHEYVNLVREFPKIRGFKPKLRYLFSRPQ
jgi:sterol desaturase/sphingolipid hydroxylase (fatty acid hydroxylase superfamily)